MSRKQIMPEPFNREAVLVGDLDRKLASYLTRDTQFQRFIRNEVEIIGAYINEFLLPQPEETSTVFVGRWISNRDSELYVRASDSGTIAGRIALSQMHQIVREEIPIWSYVFHSGNQGKFFSHSPNYGLTLKDITDATKLIEELECVLRTYGMMKS